MTQPTPDPSTAQPLVPADTSVAASPVVEPTRLVTHFWLSVRNQLAAGLLTLALLLSLWCSESRSSSPLSAGNSAPDRPFEQRVDLNLATSAELELLDGIGPKLAARIIANRDERGSFATVESIRRVKGIGPKTVEKNRRWMKAAKPQ